MFEQDYIMRLIKEMVRAVLKLLFNIDTESPTSELLEESEQKEALEELFSMVDDGKICEAEDAIFGLTEDPDKSNFKLALLFYSYLNEKSDAFLEENNFSRDEIKQGLKNISYKYGAGSVADVFLE